MVQGEGHRHLCPRRTVTVGRARGEGLDYRGHGCTKPGGLKGLTWAWPPFGAAAVAHFRLSQVDALVSGSGVVPSPTQGRAIELPAVAPSHTVRRGVSGAFHVVCAKEETKSLSSCFKLVEAWSIAMAIDNGELEPSLRIAVRATILSVSIPHTDPVNSGAAAHTVRVLLWRLRSSLGPT